MSSFQPAQYGPVFEPLLAIDRNRSLGAGRPDAASRKPLQQATLATAFGSSRLADLDMARCCLAGVWLLHDYLNESHVISQEIETSSGSFWHGVMHRREGDSRTPSIGFAASAAMTCWTSLARGCGRSPTVSLPSKLTLSRLAAFSIPIAWSTLVRPPSAAATTPSAGKCSSWNGSCCLTIASAVRWGSRVVLSPSLCSG